MKSNLDQNSIRLKVDRNEYYKQLDTMKEKREKKENGCLIHKGFGGYISSLGTWDHPSQDNRNKQIMAHNWTGPQQKSYTNGIKYFSSLLIKNQPVEIQLFNKQKIYIYIKSREMKKKRKDWVSSLNYLIFKL